MNLLTHYIKEVISIEPHTAGWTKEFNKDFVEVKMVTECYGVTENKKRVFEVNEWEAIKKEEYFIS